MLLSDVVNVLGDRPLKEFPWGCIVCDTVNLFAENHLKLQLTSTGTDLNRALEAMSETHRILLHSAQLDVNRSCVIQPVGGGMVLEHSDKDDVEPLIQLDRTSIFTILVVGTVLCMCVLMLSSLSVYQDTNWSAIKDIVTDIGSVIFGKK